MSRICREDVLGQDQVKISLYVLVIEDSFTFEKDY